MEKSFFFDAVVTGGVPDRSYSAEDIAMREAWLISDGVVGGEALTVNGTSGSGVYVYPGAAVIAGYTYVNTSILYLQIDEGHASYDRIDSVALKLDRTGRYISAVVVKGTPARAPAAPILNGTGGTTYLRLADVYIPAGSEPTVETDDITDRRVLAGYASGKDDLMLLLREYLGDISAVNAAELRNIRNAVATVKHDAGENAVLCGDGIYRQIPTLTRTVAAVYTEPGEYIFEWGRYPSENGLYDIEVQGAGGGGGSHNGTDARGGGGGAGAFLTACGVAFSRDEVNVTVGNGGRGVPGGSGEDGGASSVEGFVAKGGLGGGGGAFANGGLGGVGMFMGENGHDGAVPAGALTSECGRGGRSYYGDGAAPPETDGAASGTSAEVPGAGGSGGACDTGTFSKAGGCGGDGKVVIYRYIYPDEEGAA